MSVIIYCKINLFFMLFTRKTQKFLYYCYNDNTKGGLLHETGFSQ